LSHNSLSFSNNAPPVKFCTGLLGVAPQLAKPVQSMQKQKLTDCSSVMLMAELGFDEAYLNELRQVVPMQHSLPVMSTPLEKVAQYDALSEQQFWL
jgi:hypothetical protein